MRHLIDSSDISVAEIDELNALAKKIIDRRGDYAEKMKGRIMAALFYEPSTRTRLSFESAMHSLGGSVIGFSSAAQSSAQKGESVADTIRMVGAYADIAVIRHPKEGAALVASRCSKIPVINAGDGGHLHPTQTLTDLLTIRFIKNSLSNLVIGMCGDLMFGRTVHSLIKSLIKYPNNKFVLISPEELKIPSYLRDYLTKQNIEFTETMSLSDYAADLDILYMTRVQRERFFNEEEYVRLKDLYIINKKKLEKSKPNLAIMHPLPRVNEIAAELDSDPRAKYFEQASYGRFIRMALVLKLLEAEND